MTIQPPEVLALTDVLANPSFASPNGPTFIYASLPGHDLVEKALQAGVGNPVEGLFGALVDNRFAPPLKLSGTVYAIKEGDRNAEVKVVVKTNNNYITVTKKRKPYHREQDFTDLNLKPREADILMVKIGDLVSELYDMRGDWAMALTVGGVDQNREALPTNVSGGRYFRWIGIWKTLAYRLGSFYCRMNTSPTSIPDGAFGIHAANHMKSDVLYKL